MLYTGSKVRVVCRDENYNRLGTVIDILNGHEKPLYRVRILRFEDSCFYTLYGESDIEEV